MSKIKLNAVNHIYKNGDEYETSPYGWRIDPISHKNLFHSGEDVIGKGNLVAIQEGIVIEIRNTVTWRYIDTKPKINNDKSIWSGNYILIEHAGGFKTKHCHVKLNSFLVKVGDKVKKGQELCTAGTSGYSTGTHDHFMVYLNDKTQDPKDFIEGRREIPMFPISNKFKVGDKVKIIGLGNGSADGKAGVAGGIGWTRFIQKIYSNRPFPYQVGNGEGTIGFYGESALEPITTSSTINLGDTVIVNGYGNSSSDGTGTNTKLYSKQKMKVIAIFKNAKNAYLLNQYNAGTPLQFKDGTAWFNKDSIVK